MNNVNNVKQIKDLTGQVFGRLIVLEDAGRTKKGAVIWRCQCECGTIKDIKSGSLQSGNTQSCGCYNKERVSEAIKKDLTGQVFGRLTVLEDMGRIHGYVLWRCLCDCGNIVDVISGNLQNGNTQSCGCYKREQLSETQSGEKSHFWKGGITPLSQAVRTCIRYKEWRTAIFQRDNFTCIHCNDSTGGNLIAHHLNLFSDIMKEHNITTLEEAIQCEALWSTNNGITLCIECHEREHQRLKAIARESAHSNFITKPNQFDIDIKIKQNHYMIVQNGV